MGQARGTYSVDDDSGENGHGDGGSVRGVIFRSHHGVVVGLEEDADYGEDHDGEDGHDDAVG
jgi:hypothetical protein